MGKKNEILSVTSMTLDKSANVVLHFNDTYKSLLSTSYLDAS